MEVYADVLVVINYAANLLILLACAKITGMAVTRRRLSVGALTGAVGSLIIFLPYVGMWFQFLYQFMLAALMTFAAFGFSSTRRYCKALFAVFLTSFLFAGAVLAIILLASPPNLIFYNGVVYYDIPVLQLLLCITAAYLLVSLLEQLILGRTGEKKLYHLTMTANGTTVTLKGLADTGSNLKEPFSGVPVIVCDRELAERLRPPQQQGLRIIPCSTVTGEGALEGFRPDKVVIEREGCRIETSDVYIAASKQEIRGEYQALINPQLVDTG